MNVQLQFFAYWIRRFGSVAITGILLCAASALFYIFVTSKLEVQVKHNRENLLKTQQTKSPRSNTDSNSESRLSHAEAFYYILPAEKSVPNLMEQIIDTAYENNLDLRQATFKSTKIPDANFISFQMTLPISGTYPDIRAFLNKIMQNLPSLALEKVRIAREGTKGPELTATLSFTLYLRPGQ